MAKSELSPQLRQTQRQLTSASDAPLTDTGPVIAERRQTLVTKRSEFPEELLFKDANAEIFKIQSIDNIESFYEYESGKTNIYDVAQGVALPNVTLINPFYIGPYEGYFYVCLGCHNLHLHYKRLSNLPFLVSREYKNTLFYFKCEIKNKQPFENM